LDKEVVMSVCRGNKHFWIFLTVVISLTAVSGNVSAQDAGKPPWGEYLKKFKRDKLLKKPYHMAEETEVKGLASKIRARELDVPNRKRAIRYLKDLDCTAFPESKEMLLSLLDPKAEKFEEVRYEAAVGLRDMLAAHSCNPEVRKKSAKANRRDDDKQACHCQSCCDAKTLNTLARTAYEMKEDGCCYEPSLRVRQMTVEAIKACGVPCNYKPYYGEFDEEPGPPAVDGSGGGSENDGSGPNNGEKVPQPTTEETPTIGSNSPLLMPLPEQSTTQATPIHRLSQICIVSLTKGQPVKADTAICSEYRGRVYYFSTEAALREFETDPELFAVAFGGCDPVHFVQSKKIVEGRFLASHEGRHYMFVTKENHEEFKKNPERYVISVPNSTVALHP